MCFHAGIVCEVERLAHGVNISFGEERENVRLKARQTGHTRRTSTIPVPGQRPVPLADRVERDAEARPGKSDAVSQEFKPVPGST